jgi:hypothetical protein
MLNDVRHVYLYGASDDCMECDVIENGNKKGYESYEGIVLNDVRVRYHYDGDWGVWLESPIPVAWRVFSVRGNMPSQVRNQPHGGSALHIMIPLDEPFTVKEL